MPKPKVPHLITRLSLGGAEAKTRAELAWLAMKKQDEIRKKHPASEGWDGVAAISNKVRSRAE
ncbi:MAG TPA: hypothetical protein ENI60_01520 [Candidatus Fraserbacteria bacterium]|nr:hypothetical protein [Candidatus Fraserbacteria bacterium]